MKPLLTSPVSSSGDEGVLTLLTKTRVAPYLLYRYLNAEWVDAVDPTFYRFKSNYDETTVGHALYDINRALHEGTFSKEEKKWSKGQKLNHFTELRTDKGTYMELTAAARAQRKLPSFKRIRTTAPGIFCNTQEDQEKSRWFSVKRIPGNISEGSLINFLTSLAPGFCRAGYVRNESESSLWFNVTEQKQIERLSGKQVLHYGNTYLAMSSCCSAPTSLVQLLGNLSGSTKSLAAEIEAAQARALQTSPKKHFVFAVTTKILEKSYAGPRPSVEAKSEAKNPVQRPQRKRRSDARNTGSQQPPRSLQKTNLQNRFEALNIIPEGSEHKSQTPRTKDVITDYFQKPSTKTQDFPGPMDTDAANGHDDRNQPREQ